MSTPIELTTAPRWLCWRLEPDPKGEKPRKVPYDPKTGRKASSTNPETWAPMAEAQAAKDKYMFAGVGYVFVEESGIVGVDIDHCIDDQGNLNEIAKDIVEKYPTYTEISPSGTGLHLFYHGGMPGKGNKNSNTGVEMYANARYFTMTGNQLPGSPDDIRDGGEALAWIHSSFIAKTKKEKEKKPKKAKRAVFQMSDEELMEKVQASDNGEDFMALYNGQWEGRFGSQSEADMSLCCSLAFWSGKNPEQMDRLFRQSKLFREKWDVVHDAAGMTYGQKTIQAAIDLTEDTYSPGGPIGIYESNGRYFREAGDKVYPITNFVVEPIEMLESDVETQITCDMVTEQGDRFRQILLTSDFSSVQKFKGILNRRTIALSFTGSENDLEILKVYLWQLEWKIKHGVRAVGLYEREGHWLFADTTGAYMAGGESVDDMVQVEKAAVINSDIHTSSAATAEDLQRVGASLLSYNEPAKTVTVLAWVAGCYVKEILRSNGIKYPHLYLIGEAGSGKSTTLERIIQPLTGVSRVVAAPLVTSFTLMKEAASSNLFPQILDEYKPSKIDKVRNGALSNHFRNTYDGHEGVRGRADQSQVVYDLLAPLVIAGEEAPGETSIRERGLELLFSKRDLGDEKAKDAFRHITRERETLRKIGRLLLDTALTLNSATLKAWFNEALGLFNPEFPTRTINNLACGYVGLRVMETALQRCGVTWSQVYPLAMDQCSKWLETAAFEYLLNGRTNTVTVVEQSLEIMDRMGLSDEECKFIEGGLVALHFKSFYDRFTRYIRENGIVVEHLQYDQFMRQLRKSVLFLEMRTVRFGGGGDPKKAAVLDYEAIQEACDVDGFIKSQIDAL